MYRGYKTEIDPTEEQKAKIKRTIGTCRYIYNLFIEENENRHKQGLPYMNDYGFSKWLNNEFLPSNPDKAWIKEVGTKSVRQSMSNANHAYQQFFHGEAKFPRFKKKAKQDVTMAFFKNNYSDCLCERHRIKVPTLGWVKIKEKGYLPLTKDGYVIKCGAISIKGDRYYISVKVDIPAPVISGNFGDGIGIDVGIKNFAVVSNGQIFGNINKTKTVKDLERKLDREQRRLTKKLKASKSDSEKKNIAKQRLKVQKVYQRLTNIRTDYVDKVINEIVRTKPSYITIEHLHVRNMAKNKHLSKSITELKIAEFVQKLKFKCSCYGIELRQVGEFYPSSKTCHNCGSVNKGLKLSDRIYKCGCGYVEDRDYNASLNLRDAEVYTVIA